MVELTAPRSRPALWFTLLGLVLGLSGCEGCSCQQDRLVTFGLDVGPHGAGSATPDDAPGADGQQAGTNEWTARDARALPPGTQRVELSGHPLQVSDGELRAILMVDVDSDGDEDAYVLQARGPGADGGQAELRLSLARVAPTGLVVSELGQSEVPGVCTLSDAHGQTLAPSLVALGALYACPTGPASVSLIATLEAQPRLAERVSLWAPRATADAPATEGSPTASSLAPGEPPASAAGAAGELPLSLALRAIDSNEDGAADLVAQLMLGAGEAQVSVELTWLSGASGLTRDRSEPEATLRALANAAAEPLTRQPEVALRGAQRVLSLYQALCSEGGAPRVQLGTVMGLPCGRSRGAGKAAAVLAAAHAQAGNVFEAAAAIARLDDPAFALSTAERRMVSRALGRAPGPRGLTMRKLADVTGRTGLSFLDDQHVQLPGGRVLSLRAPAPPGATGTSTARPGAGDTAAADTGASSATPAATPAPGGGASRAPEAPSGGPSAEDPAAPAARDATGGAAPTAGGAPASPSGNTVEDQSGAGATASLPPPRPNAGLIVDPSGRFRVQRVGRGCAAYAIELVALDPVLHGPPRVAAIAPLDAPRCQADTPPALEAAEDGGFVPLGWAPQGVLVARGASLWVVPLTDDARPAGAPFVVAPGALPPAPVNGPAITRDGTRYVTALDMGVVLHSVGPEPSVTLLRPSGWSDLPSDAPLRGLALSPGGNAAVLQRGAAVYLLTW